MGDTIQLFNGTQAGLSIYDALTNAILDMTSFVEFSRPGYDLIGWTYYMRHISSGGDTVTRAYQIYFNRENNEIRLFCRRMRRKPIRSLSIPSTPSGLPKTGYTQSNTWHPSPPTSQ